MAWGGGTIRHQAHDDHILLGSMAMAGKVNIIRVSALALVLLMAALAVLWQQGVFGWRKLKGPMANSLMVIQPYRLAGTWVFDDPGAGLHQEPFVAGVPEMIDVLVKEIPDADGGFRLLFSAQPFPDYQKKLTWLRGDKGGNYYLMDEPRMEGWLCPGLFRYYESAPQALFVKAEKL
jgi:hypothetical protein